MCLVHGTLNLTQSISQSLRHDAGAHPFYCALILDVADLKRRLIAAWSCPQPHVIDEAIDQ